MKRKILTLTVLSLMMTIPTFGAKEYGDLPAPEIFGAWISFGDSTGLIWDSVEGADKYSVEIEGLAIFNDGDEVDGDGDAEPLDPEILEVTVSFGTSELSLTVTYEELAEAITAELGIPAEDVVAFDDLIYKVKALAPGKDKGRQNNEFSIEDVSDSELWIIEF